MVGVRLWHFCDLALISPISNAGMKNDLSRCIKAAMVLDNRIKEEAVGEEGKLNMSTTNTLRMQSECEGEVYFVFSHNGSGRFHMHMQNLVCLNWTLECFLPQCDLRNTSVVQTGLTKSFVFTSCKWNLAWINDSQEVIEPWISQNTRCAFL